MKLIRIVDGLNVQVPSACQHIDNCQVSKHVAGWKPSLMDVSSENKISANATYK